MIAIAAAVQAVTALISATLPYLDQQRAPSQVSKSTVENAPLEELKLSDFCTSAAKKFWNRNSWKSEARLSYLVSYTSHYNKSIHKCLVDVHIGDAETLKGKILEADHVWDASEDMVLGGQWITKALPGGPNAEVLKASFIKDGHGVVGKNEIDLFIPWFKALMLE